MTLSIGPIWSIITLATILSHSYIVSGQYRRVCYYTNWAQYRPSEGKYFPEDVDPNLCSHIVYAFAKLNGNKLVAFEWNDESTEWMRGMYDRYNDIKKTNPEIKTLLAVGGWNMASAPFTAMVATAANRSEFATSTVRFLRDRNFDGVDIDWEYPANRGSPPEDKYRYTMLVQEVRRVFDEEARRTGRQPLLLTSAVAAGKSNIDSAYDIPQVCRDMDFISLMSYDLHGSWENVTGHNSPLFPHSREIGEQRYLNMDWSANYWVQKGCPKEKLVIGMGLYGRSFTLADPNKNHLMAPVKGKGKDGKFTREGGFLAYYEICDMLATGGRSYYIKDQEVPYAVLGDQWVGYDNVESLKIKVQWMKQNGFSGVMVWALDLDDYDGKKCGQGRYPLLTAINQELIGSNMIPPRRQQPRPQPKPRPASPPKQNIWDMGNAPPAWDTGNTQWTAQQNGNAWQPTTKVTPKPPVTTTTQAQPHLTKEFDCPPTGDKYFPVPNSCHEYYICAGGISFKFQCATPLLWNTAVRYCDWPDNVACTTAPKPNKPNPNPAPKPPGRPRLPGSNAAPPRQQNNIAPPVRQNNLATPRRQNNIAPNMRQNNFAPNMRQNNLAPPPSQNNPVLPRRPNTIPPTRRKDTIPPIMQRNTIPPTRRQNVNRPAVSRPAVPQGTRRQQIPQQGQRPRWQQNPPPTVFPTRRQAPVHRFFTTPAPVHRTTISNTAYPTPPWNDWYRFLSEFWRVMATLGASPPGQGTNNLPGTIAGLPQPGPVRPAVTQRPKPFCADRTDGIYPDPLDCSKYINCVKGRAYKTSCPANTAFDATYGVCDYRHNIARCAP